MYKIKEFIYETPYYNGDFFVYKEYEVYIGDYFKGIFYEVPSLIKGNYKLVKEVLM